MGNPRKSVMTFLLNVLGRVCAFVATYLAVLWLWRWKPAVGLIAGIPVYMLALSLLRLLTAPLYRFTPEDRVIKEAFQALQDGDYERSRALAGRLPSESTEDFEGLFPRDEDDVWDADQDHKIEGPLLLAGSSPSVYRHHSRQSQ